MQVSHQKVDIDLFLQEASLLEKISLLAGSDLWHTTPIPKYGIPAIKTTDGPNGARGSKYFNPVPAACIPSGHGLGATWNDSLVQEAGVLLSKECAAKGAHVWLGPNVGIPRSPLNGRAFECLSEDPHLSGRLAAAIIRGVRSGGTLAALKHFVANDQETEKISIDVCVSDRALREIYLMPFQIALRDSDPGVIIASYNKVQGTHASESPKLLDQILRIEWGFDGLVMSDWYGTYSCEAALTAGLDIEMPGPPRHRTRGVAQSIATGKLHRHIIDVRVRKVLEFVNEASAAQVAKVETTRDVPSDRALNRLIATESIVLLKNSSGTLPIVSHECEEVAIIGPNAKLPGACGGGSANLRPYYTSSIYQGIAASLPDNAVIHYETGVYGHIHLPIFSDGNVTNDTDEPGVSIEFFNDPASCPGRKPFDSCTIHETTYQLMDYTHPAAKDPFYISMRANIVPDVSGLYEFGIASYGTSELYINDVLVIDNNAAEQKFGGMFFGKGSVEKRGFLELEAGKRYNLRVEAGSASTSVVAGGHGLPLPGGACRLGGCLKIDPEESIQRAVELARKCKLTFVVAGLNADIEKEGSDRSVLEMPPFVDKLIDSVLAANPSAIVITQSGSPVAMPWRDSASTILHSWYGGSEGGNAVADILFGTANPSGKLPVTFPVRLEDTPSYLSFGSDNGKILYAEDVFVGYRGYEARGIEVAFPFGHGLSYTTFTASSVTVTPRAKSTQISVDVKNTGDRAGAEVVFLYVAFSPSSSSKSRFLRPKRELKGYKKVFLQPGEMKTATISIDKYATAVWDEKRDAWCNEKGRYALSVVVGKTTLHEAFEIKAEEFWNGL